MGARRSHAPSELRELAQPFPRAVGLGRREERDDRRAEEEDVHRHHRVAERSQGLAQALRAPRQRIGGGNNENEATLVCQMSWSRSRIKGHCTHTNRRLSALRDEMRHGGCDELRAAVGASVEGPE